MEGSRERRTVMEGRYTKWPELTIVGYFEDCVRDFAERPLVITDERSWSYEEIDAESKRIVSALNAAGIGAGERVAMFMPNCPILPALMLATWRVGAIVVPLNTSYRADELAYALEQSQSAMLIVGRVPEVPNLASIVATAIGEDQIDRRGKFPFLRTVLYYGYGSEQADSLETRLSILGSAPRPAAGQSAHAAAVIMYTSGTTGSPKGVVLSHDNLLRAAYGECHHKAFEDGRRAVFSLPMFHAFGLVVGFLAGLPVGGAIIPLPKFDPPKILQAIGQHKATFLMAVPTMTVALLEAEMQPQYDFTSLRSIHSSAAATPSWVWDAIYARFGRIDVFTSYGMTETTATITCSLPGDELDVVRTTVGCVLDAGMAGIPGLSGGVAEFQFISPGTGQPSSPGEAGEICVRTPLSTQGYYRKPEETAKLIDEEGWLHTGDLGKFDERGYLVLTGRLKELYKSGGELVSPKEVEEVLTRHPGILQAYVFGVPDPRWGEAGCAFIVSGETQLSEDEVRIYVKEQLAGFKVPKYVFNIEGKDLPRTSTGKVQKFELRDSALKRLKL